MASATGKQSVADIAVKKMKTLAKGVGSEGAKTLDELASPKRFLSWQFPDWKSNNKTVMVPPVFTPSQLGLTVSRDGRYLHEDNDNIRGILGEKLVYERLQQIGKANDMGMFVIHDFSLQDILKWNKKWQKTEQRKQNQVPSISKSTGQADFLIFYHKKGVILLEVKNLKKEDKDRSINKKEKLMPQACGDKMGEQLSCESGAECKPNYDKAGTQSTKQLRRSAKETTTPSNVDQKITDAMKQLKTDRLIIEAFAKIDSDKDEGGVSHPVPVISVIALTSTKKGTTHMHPEDALFVYEDDLISPEVFLKWWNQNVEEALSMEITTKAAEAYELALSRTLAVRHLGPVSEPEYTAYTSHSLETFQHLENARKRFQILQGKEYPHLFQWCQEMFQVVEYPSELPTSKVLKENLCTALQSLRIRNEGKYLFRELNDKLHCIRSRFFCGDKPTTQDISIFHYLSQEYVIDMSSIISYLNRVAQTSQAANTLTTNRTLVELNLDNTDKTSSLNQLSRLLIQSKSQFLMGSSCTTLDVELCNQLTKGDIRVLSLPNKLSLPPIFTAEQLAVFEGPKKQLIIGGPGSGKTELMRCKALMLSREIEENEKILYLIQLPATNRTVLPSTMEQYFRVNKARNVFVKTMALQGEHPEVFDDQHSKIKLEDYHHVFIDELWIGSKVRYQMCKDSERIDEKDELKFVKDAIEKIVGYVWMSSVFDYRLECFDEVKNPEEIDHILKKERLEGKECPVYKELGTLLLLDTLRRNGGVVRRIKHLLRSTNNIVRLLQDYSACYSDRDFPYGTDQMLNHNVDGQEIEWIDITSEAKLNPALQNSLEKREELTRLIYKKCGDIIRQATHSTAELRPNSSNKATNSGVKFHLQAGDILVVNFVARYQTDNNLSNELAHEVHDLRKGSVHGNFSEVCKDKVCLLNSMSREDSSLIDGAEWPMVILLLTSELLFTTAKKVPFEMLRNYDAYIAMFRAQAKLVVISDSWTNQQDFLKAVKAKVK